MLAQRRARGEADLGGNAVDGKIGGLQQLSGAEQALLDEPAAGSGADLVAEAAGEGAAALATSLPSSLRIRCRHRSIPEAAPAECFLIPTGTAPQPKRHRAPPRAFARKYAT